MKVPESLADRIMARALHLAEEAGRGDEVPVGAVITNRDGQIIAEAKNEMRARTSALAHAEMLAIEQAQRIIGNARLTGCDIWVTLEPCAMCAGAISHARLRRLYFGAGDPKGGAIDHGPCLFSQPTLHHRPEIIGGLHERACRAQLQEFFSRRR